MRIALLTWSNRRVGGVETYLGAIIPELARAGHELAFCSEVNEPVERARIELPENSPGWCVAEIGVEAAVSALSEWHPDVIYCHKLADPDWERKVLGLAPSVFFAHDYNGTCISGTKTFKFPVMQPCSRSFGWQCLVHYFPHRCGGLSPVTMLQLYSLQSRRLENLREYDAIMTHSDHMLAELTKHGLSAQRAYGLPSYEQPAKVSSNPASRLSETPRDVKAELNLLFSGRMEYLKGGHVFIDALTEVAIALERPLRVTFAGDGRERPALEIQAARVRRPKLKIEFAGWVGRRQLETLLKVCDLLVLPSLWPEPFGLVGLEAGAFGVPVAAFDVGGIRDWLSDGVNGYLAPGTPPPSKGLAQAIIKCLRDPDVHAHLRQGAIEVSQKFNIKNHLTALLEVFSNVTAHN